MQIKSIYCIFNKKSMTKTEQFIEKAKLVHNRENLDYSKVVYKNNRTPVLIIDHDLDENGVEYGEFWQTPWNHLNGQCHPKKRAKRISEGKRSKQEEIIERFKKVHANENLDYSEVKYVNMHTKVKIISHDLRPDGTEYGEFWQEPSAHLRGCTHPDIGKKKQINSQTYTTEEFINKAKKVHVNDNYDYSHVCYTKSKTKVEIICNKIGTNGKQHGSFMTSPDLFLMGKGCPKCGNHLSYAEDELYEYICGLMGKENVQKRNKTILDGKEIDIYIPSLKIGFEYNGIRWHSEEFGKDRLYHINKTRKAKEKGVTLIQIFEDEFVLKKEIVLSKIKHILQKNNNLEKIYARKTSVSEIDKDFAREFLEEFHIQGFVNSTIYLGLFYKGSLIGVMSFLNEKNGNWNLTRFVTDVNFICVGAASKLFSYFIKNYNPTLVKSFLDRRWCRNEENNVYIKLGFKFDKYTEPEYRYITGDGLRHHKFGFRKQTLSKKYGFPLSMTESEMTEALGYKKIWDCGLIRYVWTKE